MSKAVSEDSDNYTSTKRCRSYWDPIYDPNGPISMVRSEWDFEGITGVSNRLYEATSLFEATTNLSQFTLRKKNFEICDFRGDFSAKNITFVQCVFNKCDFGYATWKNVKFTECTFSECSFTLTKFEDSQFRDCLFSKICISGNETRFINTVITNPGSFVQAAATNVDNVELLAQKGTNPSFQLMRLEESKAKLSKIILSSIDGVGDDNSYYDAIKTYSNQKITEKIFKSRHQIFSRKNVAKNRFLLGAYFLEKWVINISGSINGWGNNVALPIAIGFFLILLFSVFYQAFGIATSIPLAVMMAFDVTFLFGYTKHATSGLSFSVQVLYGVNAFFGLWWYAVLVPTVINRISRVRS